MSRAALRALACCGGTGNTASTKPGAGRGAGRQGPKAHGRGAIGVATF